VFAVGAAAVFTARFAVAAFTSHHVITAGIAAAVFTVTASASHVVTAGFAVCAAALAVCTAAFTSTTDSGLVGGVHLCGVHLCGVHLYIKCEEIIVRDSGKFDMLKYT
jgi:hypothetical protein